MSDTLTGTLTDLSEASADTVERGWPDHARWAADQTRTLPDDLRRGVRTVADAAAADPVIEDGLHDRVTAAATTSLAAILSDLRDRDPDGYRALTTEAGDPDVDPDDAADAVMAHPTLAAFVLQPALTRWRELARSTST